jgi:hypothetical protein
MARKEKKYHYIYKIICLKNERYYIGMHSTDNLEDGYMGGGKRIKNSVKKHGKDAHRKDILEFFESRELLRQREIELVTEELLNDPMCINIMKGGEGGYISVENQKARSIAGGKAFAKRLLEDVDLLNRVSKQGFDNMAKAHKEGKFRYDNFKNKNHSLETILKMKDSAKGKHEGEKNSQFGTTWITNGKENKKIKKEEIIPEYWRKGRI